jgi:hypothetical protein
MTKKNTTDDDGPNYYDEHLFERLEQTKRALIDNVMLTRNPPPMKVQMTETTIERLCVDIMRTRCDLCYELTGPNKHSAVLVVDGTKVCWCCWFDKAFYDQPYPDKKYFSSRTRIRRMAVCSGIRVYGTPSLGDEYADYVRSHNFESDVMQERLRKIFGK